MITEDADNPSSSADDCINPAGFGYSSEGASRCPVGFYSEYGSRKPCKKCPEGRTTMDMPLMQQKPTHCFVLPGFGVALTNKSNANATEVFGVDTSSMTIDQAASLAVLQCPVGWYGSGGDLDSSCVPCPCGTTTQASGSDNITDCNGAPHHGMDLSAASITIIDCACLLAVLHAAGSAHRPLVLLPNTIARCPRPPSQPLANTTVCLPGLARAANAPADTPCTPCPFGSYSTGGGTTCTSCPSATFAAPIDGRSGGPWTSNGTTLFDGATSPDACEL